MDAPKISVLIPMYNRKHYIGDCITSVLNQTFKDFEIIIRDNCSTDGSFEFVAEKFSDQIASGKIKLIHNKMNFLLEGSSNRLMTDALGKYILFLHSDDVLLPNALQHLYEVAEVTNADVVHESYYLSASENVYDKSQWKVSCNETNPVEQVAVMSNDPLQKFNEWNLDGTFHDVQYNLLNRKFMLENRIFFKYDYKYASLWWIMFADVFVKTPVVCYIRRNAPDAGSRNTHLNKIDPLISTLVKVCNDFDERFSEVEFLKNNVNLQYVAKSKFLDVFSTYFIHFAGFYKKGITPEILNEMSTAFKKHFGDNYFFPMFLFNWQQSILYSKMPTQIVSTPPLPPQRDS